MTLLWYNIIYNTKYVKNRANVMWKQEIDMELVVATVVFLLMIVIGMLFGRMSIILGLIFEKIIKFIKRLY